MLERVRAQLNAAKGNWPQICLDCRLPYSWLQKFAQGQIRNPGVERIELLDAYFRSAA